MAKNSSWPVTGLGNKGPLKVLNGTKLILDDHGNNLDSFRIRLKSFRSFRGPLLLQPVTVQELFFALSYSKPTLIMGRIKCISNRHFKFKFSIFQYFFYLPVYSSMATTQCPSIETIFPSKERSGPDDQTPSINKLVLPDNSYSYVIIEIGIKYVILLKCSE